MKRFIFILLFFALYIYASDTIWLHDYSKAMTKAEQTNKSVLLMYSAKT